MLSNGEGCRSGRPYPFKPVVLLMVEGRPVASQLGLTGMVRVGNRDHAAVPIVARDHRIKRRSTNLGWPGRSRRREGGAENDCGGKRNLRLAKHCHISSLRYGRCDRTQQESPFTPELFPTADGQGVTPSNVFMITEWGIKQRRDRSCA